MSGLAPLHNGNYIVDLHFKEPIKDVNAAANDLKNTVGRDWLPNSFCSRRVEMP